MEVIDKFHSHDGEQLIVKHYSSSNKCEMKFSLFLPPASRSGKVPIIWYLSGLTCSHANVTEKGEYRQKASELGIAFICPDTSPRGDNIPDEKDNWQFGSGAGFYLDATEPPYDKNYKMYSYIIDELPGVIENYFDKIAKKDGITSLNTAFSSEGSFIHIPKNIQVDKPIQIIYFSTGKNESVLYQPRNLVVVDENSQVEIIEKYHSLNDNSVLVNTVTEIYADKKSNVKHYKIQNDNNTSSLIDNTFVSQEHSSSYSLHTFSFGGELIRNNLNIFQNDERIESSINGITIIDDNQHVDHNTLIHHRKPNCNSYQDYKGIFGGKSVGVFNGRVLVEKEAQKTNAFQANNNVLISDKAAINTKPQLEIFADDVKCSHGCTVGQLDKNALFYLRSRGIAEKEATALMMYGFANKVLTSVEIPEIKARINRIIANKLGVDIGFDI